MATRQQDKTKYRVKNVPTPAGPLHDQYDDTTDRARQRAADDAAARTSNDDELESPMPKAVQDQLAYLQSKISALSGIKDRLLHK